MSTYHESCLEMSLMFPAAIFCKWLPYDPEKGNFDIKLEQEKDVLNLTLIGKADAVLLLESLREIVRFADKKSLRIILDKLNGLDQLSLSALMVVLRACRKKFKDVMVTGLHPWASDRLYKTGVKNLMGKEWVAVFEDNTVYFRFERQPGQRRTTGQEALPAIGPMAA